MYGDIEKLLLMFRKSSQGSQVDLEHATVNPKSITLPLISAGSSIHPPHLLSLLDDLDPISSQVDFLQPIEDLFSFQYKEPKIVDNIELARNTGTKASITLQTEDEEGAYSGVKMDRLSSDIIIPQPYLTSFLIILVNI